MNGPTGKSIVRALLDPKPSHPSVVRRGNRVAEVCAENAELRTERDRLLAENRELFAANVGLSADLAAANTRIADLERQADLSARQRNTRMRYFA